MTTPASFLTEEMRQQVIGQKSAPSTTDIEKGAIIKFAQAIEDDNPVFNDDMAARDSRYGGIIAPPTFLRSVGVDRPAYPFDMPFNRLLDGGSEWEYFHPVRAGDRITAAFEELYGGSASGMVASSAEEGFEAIRMLRSANSTGRDPGNGARYPGGEFGSQMRQLAQLIKSDIGLEIGFASVGGWDTHANQGASQGQLATRLRQFGDTLAAFARDLGPRMADVVVLTMSEFGRTVAENGNRGTDHGRATAMLVLGGNANGGKVLGRWPTLDPERRADGRDLAVTTDFRDLFGEILVKHLGAASLAQVFPGYGGSVDRWVGAMR